VLLPPGWGSRLLAAVLGITVGDDGSQVVAVLGVAESLKHRRKGRRERALSFGRTAALALDRYLRARVRHPQAHLEWLWLGKKGSLTASGLAQMLDAGATRPACRACTPTACATPSPTSGSPKVVVKRT
jgi:hypothetical protein